MLHGLGILHFHMTHQQSGSCGPLGVISLLWLEDLSDNFKPILKEHEI
jgi:hypothetical protein